MSVTRNRGLSPIITLVTGIAATTDASNIAAATSAAVIETENNRFFRGKDGLLWTENPTADEMDSHRLGKGPGKPGEDVYRKGSDVSLAAYPQSALNVLISGQKHDISASPPVLATALASWEVGTLQPGALTDAFIYGSLGKIQVIDGSHVQLAPDFYNFEMEKGRGLSNFDLRNTMTEIQHQTLGRGLPGTKFQTIFVGPTSLPTPILPSLLMPR